MQDPNDNDDLKKIWSKKPRYNKDGTLRKPRRGWGPYRSVVNERATAFNLQLDVQNLQQEVQNLTALRDILQTKTLLQRHTPEGSLLKKVKEYFTVFRTGAVVDQPGRKRLLQYTDQREFMYSVMENEVDLGDGLRGPEVMMNQITMYSTFIKFILLEMHSYDIAVAEDEVVIATRATLHFQVLRNTIEMIFPHIIAEEWLVAQLVGQEVELPLGMTFYFNKSDKCCKYQWDVDFVGAFTSIIDDPAVVDLLLGRALITDNYLLGVAEPEDEEKPAAPAGKSLDLESGRYFMENEYGDKSLPSSLALNDQRRPRPSYESAQVYCLHVVESYFAAFEAGYQAESVSDSAESASVMQTEFILRHCVSEQTMDGYTSAEYIVRKWRSLSECFAVLGFQQKAVASVQYDNRFGECVINSSARYILRITDNSLRLVFPHLDARTLLRDALLGKIISVASQIKFSVESGSGQFWIVQEHMDFAGALSKLVESRQSALALVMSDARLAPDGVSYRSNNPLPRFLGIAAHANPDEDGDGSVWRF